MSLMDRLKSENMRQIVRKKFFGRSVDLPASQYEVQVLCEAEKQIVEVPIHIKSHLARIAGAVKVSTVKKELEWLFKTDMEHGPTQLYKIKNARFGASGLWADATHYLDRNVKKNNNLNAVNLEAAVLADSDNSSEYFGHWLTDFIPATIINYGTHPALSLSKPDYMHAAGYLELLDINNVIYANKGFVKELYFLDDFFTLNSYKIKRYRALSKRIKNKISPAINNYAGVYIVRGNNGEKRRLLNEAKVVEFLSKKGFYILYPEKKTAHEIARILLNAPFVISVEGSALAHAILAASKHAGYLILMPPNRCCFYFKATLDALGHAWGVYVCKQSVDASSFCLDSFDDLDKLIDRVRTKSETKVAA